MDIAQIQEDLETWVRSQGLPCMWEDKPQKALTFPRVILSGPHSIVALGQDWVSNEDGPDNTSIPTVVGNREILFGLRVVNRSQAGNATGQFWCEKLRASLKKPSVLLHFEASNIAIVRLGPTLKSADEPVDGRVESVASVQLRIATTIAEADSAVGTIDTVAVESRLEDPSGDVLPIPPNFDVTVGE